jgi:hypothetical protein
LKRPSAHQREARQLALLLRRGIDVIGLDAASLASRLLISGVTPG